MRYIGITLIVLSCTQAVATGVAKFKLGFGDSNTALLNGAAIGQEIPTSKPLRVVAGGTFNVQLLLEVTVPTYFRFGIFATNIAFDRSYRATAESGPLDGNAFRKIMPTYNALAQNLSNFNTFPAYWFNEPLPQDKNNDGVQDTARWDQTLSNEIGIFGTNAPGVSVRPVGLGTTIFGINQEVFGQSYAHFPTGRYRLWDYSFRNEMSAGEIYGDNNGETGLEISTHPQRIANSSTWFATFDDITFSGSRYNILAVPEPSSLFALGLGLLCLRKRK
jgi:hypothetical protein